MKQTLRRIISLSKPAVATKPFNMPSSVRYFRQTNDLNDLIAIAEKEEKQRSAKFVEYTQKVYKPSKTITFDRNGELLLFSCDSIKHSQIYLKFPYILYDSLIPIAAYNFFVDPFGLSWQIRHGIFYAFGLFGWFPHYYYIKGLLRKVHKIYLLRGGKYCRLVLNEISGNELITWVTINDMKLLNKAMDRYENIEFLTSEGQMKHEVGVELDYITISGAALNHEHLYFLKEGTVHQPEIFEQILYANNIDDSDYEINTEDNIRYLEPNHNM